MSQTHQIQAQYDRETIVVYQAYSHDIADAAITHQRFVPPFSCNRMTWIKPSFLWLMERSNWGRKKGQERTLAVRITRAGWENALSEGVLTCFDPAVHRSHKQWTSDFAETRVHIQWDPERNLRGASLPYYAIQVGLSRHIVNEYVDQWLVEIVDISKQVAAISAAVRTGSSSRAIKMLPSERDYPIEASLARRIIPVAQR